MRTALDNTKFVFTVLTIGNVRKMAKNRYFRRKNDLNHTFDANNELWVLVLVLTFSKKIKFSIDSPVTHRIHFDRQFGRKHDFWPLLGNN